MRHGGSKWVIVEHSGRFWVVIQGEKKRKKVKEVRHLHERGHSRGVEWPAQTHWSQPFLEPLDTFGQTAAEQVWQAIAGNYDEYAVKLTTAVDYVPLAVDILAHLSQMTPPMLLWEEWNSKQTKVIQMGQMHRLSNLEYSIQLSIDCQRMTANPSAKSLLGVLSMLPDGLHIKQLKQFQGMLFDVNITLCL